RRAGAAREGPGGDHLRGGRTVRCGRCTAVGAQRVQGDAGPAHDRARARGVEPMTSPIGQAVSRVDGRLKVTGAAVYAADNHPDNLAYGYLLTSTVAKGTITGMDTAAALASPGVLAVYTPFNPLKLFAYTQNQNDENRPPLQDALVRYHGQVVGLVVAGTFEQARDAAGLVTVSYDAQPPAASFAAGVPTATSGGSPTDVLAPGVASIDDALAASAVTVSATYTTP